MKGTNTKLLIFSGLALILLCLIPLVAFGQSVPTYNQALHNLRYNLGPMWRARALDIGRLIFITFVTIDVIFLGISVALGNIQRPTFQILVNKFILYAILFAILYFFNYLGYIIWGFEEIAASITGLHQNITSYNLLVEGWNFLQKVSQSSVSKFSLWSLITNDGTTLFHVVIMMLLGMAVFVGFFVIALEYVFLQIEVVIAIIIGPIFLGFSPLKSTRGWGTAYITYLVGLGVRLFLFFVILGFAYGTINSIIATLHASQEVTFSIVLQVAFMAVLTVFLLAKLPARIEDKITSKADFDIEGLLPTTLNH